MNFYESLENCGLESLENKKFSYKLYDDILTIDYVECQKKYKDETIALYFVFDISNFDNQSSLLITNYDNFIKFQEHFISKLFYSCASNLKFNLYQIFAYQDQKNTFVENEIKNKIEWNLDYSRKIFLKYSELKKYFSYYDVLDSFKPSRKYESAKFETIKQNILKLDNYGLKSALVTKITDENKNDFLKTLIKAGEEPKANYDFIKNNNLSSEQFFDKYFVKLNQKKYIKKRTNYKLEFKHIDKVINKSFRKNVLYKDEIIFKKFNLLCGKNASGKTSLLELIEYTLTGKTRKDDKSEGLSIIYSSNGNVFSSEQAKKDPISIKNAWYSNKIGNLNKLFCRINYFDIDAAYNFAIEYENTKYQDFLCDYQLRFMKENLLEHISIINTIENTMESFISFVDSKSDKTQNLDFISSFKIKIRKLLKKQPVFYENTEATKLYVLCLNKIDEYKKVLLECAKNIDEIIEDETHMYMDNINTVYWVLFSKDQKLDYDSLHKNLTINRQNTDNKPSYLDEISTAQRVCVALSVIFAQFFSATNAPKFILLDETVANFDSIHLLNLLDFLRELVINDVQIIFTTADENIKNLVQKKLSFLKDDLKIIDVNYQSENELINLED